MKFEAVNLEQLRERLDRQCSPDPGRSGYVIGPDKNNRLCHVASCRNMQEAKRYAENLNKEFGND